ncbi:hypothetical protein L6164_015988 [Bauhinia variegata]|uniref:Uncharacterized protein n=1 Tax=Bauhinia variegata TaxID=167791 RepID=A0ACB9NPB1_BAUVA|nr:hypothetical protein L6164_015988 [Bauhinia variegata]
MGSLGDVDSPPSLSSRISTVVPATPRGEENGAHELQFMDLLVKLHYFRAVYFFNSEAVQGFTSHDLKKPMFPLLDSCYHVSGRIRRSENGRPFIKCNDAGVRVGEAHCDKSLDEWFGENGYSLDGGLVHDHVLGPDIGFSPLVFVKFTWFKCGGLSVGLSWAHVLGDACSALNFIAMWSQILAGQMPPKSLQVPNPTKPEFPPSVSQNPISVRSANVIGEYWLATNAIKLETHSFYVTSAQLEHLVSVTFGPNKQYAAETTSYFEILSALLWNFISRIRGDSGPSAVTICTNTSNRTENYFPINGLVLSKVEADLEARNSDISELSRLIAEKKMVENHGVEKLMEKDEGIGDFIVYGANLTFVDFEEFKFYGVKLNGQKPILANCTFHGVGDQGVVLVLPGPEDNKENGGIGRMITVTLPEKELDQLKHQLNREWGIV